jgi:hypothetical protein
VAATLLAAGMLTGPLAGAAGAAPAACTIVVGPTGAANADDNGPGTPFR